MSTGTIILIIVIVIVVLALLGLAARMSGKKKREQRLAQAQSIRHEAAAEASGVHESHVRAKEAEVKAEQARLEAQRAEEQAARAHQGVSQEQALHEDKIREADRLDPRVDHKSEDYSPHTPAAETTPPAYDETGRVDPASTGAAGTTGADSGAVDAEGRPVHDHGQQLDEHGRPIQDPGEPGGTHRAP